MRFHIGIPTIVPFGLLPFLFLPGCTSYKVGSTDLVMQEVFYVTTREDSESDNPNKRFKNRRGITPEQGVVMVAVNPKDTHSPFGAPQKNFVIEQNEVIRPSQLQQVQPLDRSSFFDNLGKVLAGSGEAQDILIYIHGYLKDFDDSMNVAGETRYELAFPGPVISFSWPSTKDIAGYVADLDNLYWSTPQFRLLINDISSKFPDSKIHIAAHSMGNRALIRSLIQLKEDYPGFENWPIGEIIFLAPDFDRAIFIEQFAEEIRHMPSRKTIYVSDQDFPLMASGRLYRYQRLGDSRNGPPIVEGFETIDVSDSVNMGAGHGYYEQDSEAMADLYYLLRDNLGADERPTLMKVETDEGSYWRLKTIYQ